MAEVNKRKSQGTRAPACTIQQPSANLLRVTLVNTTDRHASECPQALRQKSRAPIFASICRSVPVAVLVTLDSKKGSAAKTFRHERLGSVLVLNSPTFRESLWKRVHPVRHKAKDTLSRDLLSSEPFLIRCDPAFPPVVVGLISTLMHRRYSVFF